MVDTKNTQKSTVNKAEKEQLIQWVKETAERDKYYTQKQINTMLELARQGKRQEIVWTLAKIHGLPIAIPCCYCQQKAYTWQEKMNKAQLLLELAEKEGNEAEKLRIQKAVGFFTQQFQKSHNE